MNDNIKIFNRNCRIYIQRKIFKLDYKNFIKFAKLDITLNDFLDNYVNNKKIKIKIAVNVYENDDIFGIYIYDNYGKLIKNII